MFTSLRSRLWITYALIIGVVLAVVTIAVIIFLVRNPPALRLERARFTDLVASLPLDNIPRDNLSQLEEALIQFDQENDVRVILRDAEGVNLIDTRADSAQPIPELRLPPRRFGQIPVSEFNDINGDIWLYTGRNFIRGQSLIFAIPRPGVPLFSILADELFSPLFQAGGLALLLSLLLAILISRWVAAPLQRMAGAARAVAAGEHRKIKVEGPKEVQRLGRAFNEMVSKVHASRKSQRDFVANVSHELKTPLTSIQGFAQAMLDGTVDSIDSLDQAAKVIYDESGRMHRMVIDLLDLAKLDAGTADLERKPLNLSLLLEGVMEKFLPQSRKAEVELNTNVDQLPQFIGDGDRLAQVFTNLVDNALKQTPSGGEVWMRANHVGDQLQISVTDTGEGVPKDKLARIFERFYQLDNARRGGDGRGVGLGLTIAREIVHAHKGDISVQSELGKGSTFTVRLPAAMPEDQTLATERQHISRA